MEHGREERPVPCEVVFHSGYKGEETPRLLRVRGLEIPIDEVVERKRILESGSDVLSEEFVCRAGERTLLLRRSKDGRWAVRDADAPSLP